MKTIKESFVKLLFTLPMLAILVATTGIVSFIANSESNTIYSAEKSTAHNDVTITGASYSNALLLKESEIFEFEFETNWLTSYSLPQHFLEVTQKTLSFSNFKKIFATNKNVALYDLFCNWKLHIS